jgi:hypothetical protein
MSKDVIVLTGVKETLKALETFDKNAVKEFNKILNSELSSAKKEAQGLVKSEPPLSGWATQPARNPRSRGGAGWPAWDQSVIKAGITSTKAEGKVRRDYTTNAGALKNRSAAGVIYELAGRKNKTAGKNKFIDNLSREDSPFMPSRLIWHVVDKNRNKMSENIYNALEKAKSTLQKNLLMRRG